MDTISLHQFGFRMAVAPLGTAITEMQIELLWKLASEPTLCFDSDGAGRKAGIRAALRVLPILKPGYSLKFCLIEGAKDPDEFLHAYGHDKFQEMLDTKCISLSDILWMYFTSEREVKTPEQRAGLEQDISRELSRIKSESIRKFYLEEFTNRMRREFTIKPSKAPQKVLPKANPENLNEKMILAFSIAYPNLFAKFLETGKRLELTHPLYKKMFDAVVAEVSITPHTRETILRFLNGKGFNPQVLLKFELKSLIDNPADASKLLDERVMRYDLERLNNELRELNARLFSVSGDDLTHLQEQISIVKDEINKLTLKLEDVS